MVYNSVTFKEFPSLDREKQRTIRGYSGMVESRPFVIRELFMNILPTPSLTYNLLTEDSIGGSSPEKGGHRKIKFNRHRSLGDTNDCRQKRTSTCVDRM